MRVLVLTTWFPDASTPSKAPFNLLHVQAIAQRHDVRVIHFQLGGIGPVTEEDYDGVRVIRAPVSPRRPLQALAAMRLLAVGRKTTDVLHTMAFTSAVAAAPVAIFHTTPWVHTEHWSGMANPASVSKKWAAFAWLRYVLKLPDAVTAVSSAQAEQLRRFARRRGLSVVPNVVLSQDSLAERTGQKRGVVRIVSVGGLITRKRPGLALETLRILRAEGVSASLTWVGDGPLHADLEKMAAAAGLASEFSITGLLPPDQVAAKLRNADVFLLPTHHETFCVSAAEAIAAGIPAVVTDLPAVRDFLTEKNSVLVSAGRAEDYARGVLLALERFAEVPSSDIAETVSLRYSPTAVAELFSDIYNHIQRFTK